VYEYLARSLSPEEEKEEEEEEEEEEDKEVNHSSTE
jgi:hypothetical protein